MVQFKSMNQITKEELGKKIRDLREKNDKSQEELGKFLNRSHAAVSDIERGKTDLSVSDLTKISQFFEVSVETFLSPNSTPSSISFSHSRIELGLSDEEREKILKSREEFRKKAKEAQKNK